MTRKILLIAGVAGLALTAPATAEKGGRSDGEKQQTQTQGQAKQGGGERAQRPQRPQRQQAERQQVQRAERPQRAERQMQRMERPQRAERQRMRQVEHTQRTERREVRRVERPQRIERQQSRQVERAERREMRRVDRPQRIERQQARQVERAQRREMRRAERPLRIERQQARQAQRAEQRPDRLLAREDRRELRQAARRGDLQRFRDAPLAERQQRVFKRLVERRDMRPMRELRQPRISIGERISASAFAPVPTIYAGRYYDTPDYYYRYDDDYGYVYRVNRDNNFVSALMPMFGGYSIGDPWPSMFRSSYVPYGYQSYFYDTPDYYYRNDGYGIYQVDSSTQLITALVALLTGQTYGIGQMLPASYGAYNVPMAYRSSYYDSDDSWYRYGDGYIYQVDPYSRRIEQSYPLYVDNYLIGEPWPAAYPGYNVPYGYQDAYYDTPQHHYRFANGGIYQVDPTTQVIQALVALLSGQQFGIGQPMPAGYSAYNVPYDYRDRYADSDDEYYRYANGYVYRIDQDSGLIEEEYPIYA